MTARPDLGIDGEPELRFQPAVDMATGRLLGFEALLRWNDPVRGILGPDVILSWAESQGHLTSLNAWILLEACSEAVEWDSSVQLAVNCSASELRSRTATIAVVGALEQSGLNSDRLTVEVTETAICDNVAVGELSALANLGVQLAVDNVGPRWTGFDQPRHVAIKTMKIDRTLVDDLQSLDASNRTIIDRLISVSHARGICPVLVGIETAGQLAALRDLGADVGQGYIFARPLSASDTRTLTKAAHRSVFSVVPPAVEGRPVVALSETVTIPDRRTEFEHDHEPPIASTFGGRASWDTRTATEEFRAAPHRNRVPASFRRGRHSSS